MALIELKDVFGLSAPSTALVQAVERGVGGISRPLLEKWARKDTREDFKTYLEAARQLGFEPDSLEINIDQRASIRMTMTNARKQQSVEGVAYHAFREAGGLEVEAGNAPEVDEDWIGQFWTFAEGMSSEHMQQLFGRILARQVSGNASTSLRAVQFLSMLSAREADAITSSMAFATETTNNGVTFPAVLTHISPPVPADEDGSYYELNHHIEVASCRDQLTEIGVLAYQGIPLTLSKFKLGGLPFELQGVERPFKSPTLSFTTLGWEVAQLTRNDPDSATLRDMARRARLSGGSIVGLNSKAEQFLEAIGAN